MVSWSCCFRPSRAKWRALRHRLHEPTTRSAAAVLFRTGTWLSLVAGSDWTVLDLPEEWSWDWRVLETREVKGRFGVSDYVLDIEPIDG